MEEMKQIIEEALGEYPYSENRNGSWAVDIYSDYRDEISKSSVIAILESEDPMAMFYEKVDEMYEDQVWIHRHHIEKLVEDRAGEGFDIDLMNELLDEMVSFEIPYSQFMKQPVKANIMIDTGDENYGFDLNCVYPAYYGRKGEQINERASILWLARQQGYSKRQLWTALDEGDVETDKVNDFLTSMRQELANETSGVAVLIFLAEMTIEQLIKVNEAIRKRESGGHIYEAVSRPDCGTVTIKKEAETGLYDPWNGAGSVFEIILERDVEIPIKYIRSVLPDGGDGKWSIGSVYGMCGSAWRDVIVSIDTEVKAS